MPAFLRVWTPTSGKNPQHCGLSLLLPPQAEVFWGNNKDLRIRLLLLFFLVQLAHQIEKVKLPSFLSDV